VFVVNISIDKIDDLYQIAAIRIKPKNTPKDGELCTYQWGLLNSKNQFKKISSFTKQYHQNNAIDFSIELLQLYKDYNDTLSSISNKSID
jgi:hypothetical protein